MFKKAINFVKYNNAFTIILIIIVLAGGGVFASTDIGQAAIGKAQTTTDGIDNVLLLEADLENFNMDYKIEKIEEDEKFYYITYTFLNLDLNKDVWEYILEEKVRKVSKKMDSDLGKYLSEEFREEYDKRISDLKKKQAKAQNIGESTRVELTQYSGLIGSVLNLTGKVFDGYEPVKKKILPTPSTPVQLIQPRIVKTGTIDSKLTSPDDSITEIYTNYVEENDPDHDGLYGTADNCPYDANLDQLDTNGDGIGDVCDVNFIIKTIEERNASGTQATSTEEVVDGSIDEPSAEEPPIKEKPAEEAPSAEDITQDIKPTQDQEPAQSPEPSADSEPTSEPEPTLESILAPESEVEIIEIQ